jgi:hypothetical protein
VACYGPSIFRLTCCKGRNVAQIAASRGHLDILEYVARAAADADVQWLLRGAEGSPARSPMGCAVVSGHVDAFRWLVCHAGRRAVADEGVDVGAPLTHTAARYGYGDVLAAVEKEVGPSVSVRTSTTTGRTAFEEALHYGQVDPVEYCLDTHSPPRGAARFVARNPRPGNMHMLRLFLQHPGARESWPWPFF